MSKAILHIGLPKTGTTLIQNWLDINAPSLRSDGLVVAPLIAAHQFAVTFVTNPERRRFSDIARLERGNDERDKCFATMGRTTIISSEYFFIIDPDACASDLRHRGIEVTKVICFLRRQDVLSASGYAQDVKALGRSDVIRKVQYEAELDWHSLRNRWTNAFPGAAVEMRAYTSQGLIEKFKAAAGIKAETIDQPDERPNPSLNAEMTEVARIMNARGERPMADRLLALQARLGGASFGFAPEIVKQFEEAYLRSNRALAACFPSGEFDDLGRPGWQPTGVDLSGKVSEDRIRHIMTLLNSPGD